MIAPLQSLNPLNPDSHSIHALNNTLNTCSQHTLNGRPLLTATGATPTKTTGTAPIIPAGRNPIDSSPRRVVTTATTAAVRRRTLVSDYHQHHKENKPQSRPGNGMHNAPTNNNRPKQQTQPAHKTLIQRLRAGNIQGHDRVTYRVPMVRLPLKPLLTILVRSSQTTDPS